MRTVAGPNTRVVVVGAGLAGLSVALHLAGRGRDVTVVERENWPGGRAGRLDIDGYQLDTGPTVLTMPDIIDEAFAAVGENRSDRLDLMTVNPAYRAQFADGSSLDVHSDADLMAYVEAYSAAHYYLFERHVFVTFSATNAVTFLMYAALGTVFVRASNGTPSSGTLW